MGLLPNHIDESEGQSRIYGAKRGRRMVVHKTAGRNREIFAARQRGELIEHLANRYNLSEDTVRQIIRIERHKVAVSVDLFYEDLRLQKPGTQS